MTSLLYDPFFWNTVLFGTLLVFDCYLVHVITSELHNFRKIVNKKNKEEDDDTSVSSDDNSNDENEYLLRSDSPFTEDEKDKYTSVLFEAFYLLTKRQLLRIVGSKYKNKNKVELIVIAIHKFISNAIDNSERLPKVVKIYVKENKEEMKLELLKLYEVDTSDDNEEDNIKEE